METLTNLAEIFEIMMMMIQSKNLTNTLTSGSLRSQLSIIISVRLDNLVTSC